ncbi:helix-turn-helix domain-containing protein [Streptomyces sp. NPDC048172]|uniref:helix-turn-helix domain-containing protein n=1 Tax=Streptomyces sp. NPDC048172 TaxID=3365505 RepID=UPI0037172E40
MGVEDELNPDGARSTAEFLGLLKELRARSGLTYRQLEERAARSGDPLPRSTVSAMLRGRTLPRHELLASYVRACGDGDRLTAWLEARDRLAARPPTEGNDPPPYEEAPRLPNPRRLTVPVSIVAAVLLVTTVWLLASGNGAGDSGDRVGGTGADTSSERSGPGSPSPGRSPSAGKGSGDAEGPARGAVRIRPLSAPRLCLTDGRVDDGRYESLVAVQRPCDRTAPQKTVVRPVPGSGAHRIEWHHPEFGKGCLKVLEHGPGSGLLEPWDACGKATLFRFEPAGPGPDTYALRIDGKRCVAIRGGSGDEGAEAVARRCADERAQHFRVEPAP